MLKGMCHPRIWAEIDLNPQVWNAGDVQPPVVDRFEHPTNLRRAGKNSLEKAHIYRIPVAESADVGGKMIPGFKIFQIW